MDALSGVSTDVLIITSGVVLLTSVVGLYLLRQQKLAAGGGSNGDVDPKVAKKKSAPDAPAVVGVYYGTQTGTAEQFASTLAGRLKERFHVEVQVKDLEELGEDLDNAAEAFTAPGATLVLCSTYGDGEPPDTAAAFFEWLNGQAAACEGKNAAARPFAGNRFAVFALGNTQYEHYNNAGKQLDAQFEVCGGERLMPVGLGNDDDCIEEDFDTWSAGALEVLQAAGFATKGGAASQPAVGAPTAASVASYAVHFHPPGTVKPLPPTNAGRGYDATTPFRAALAARRELQSATAGRSTLHVDVDLSGSGLRYEAGDHLGVLPENDPELVERVATRLGWDLDAVMSVEATAGAKGAEASVGSRRSRSTDGAALNPLGHVGPLTVRTALACYCDLTAPPKKAALAALAAFAGQPADAARLARLAGKAGKDEYQTWVVDAYRGLADVLAAFPSTAPPLGAFLCSIAPRLQVRYYSISSSPATAPNTPSLTVAVVRGPTGAGGEHRGVASNWLGRLGAGERLALPAFVRTTAFRLPANPAVPVIMVGPGTGLAPFRGFLQERASLRARGAALGEAILFAGCRSAAHDYIYREELEAHLAAGDITSLQVAFSREGTKKVYVQHRLQEQGARVWAALEAGGYLYVCGDARSMARDVNRALYQIVQDHSGRSLGEAEALVRTWTEAGRYMRDVW